MYIVEPEVSGNLRIDRVVSAGLSVMNFSTQSSFAWYSGSVSKSHTVADQSPAQRRAGLVDEAIPS